MTIDQVLATNKKAYMGWPKRLSPMAYDDP